jgi:acetylornithine deacetylase/succinyl-diaminopimelate desuccinylase-like protein
MSAREFGVDYYKKIFRAQEKALLEDFYTFLRFKTISAVPNKSEFEKASLWLRDRLESRGFLVELWNTESIPCLFASWMKAGPEKPTLLLYNHYDVQPVDPIDLWHSPPFEPRKEGHHIFARGASDNKGQCFYVLQALLLYLEHKKELPINIKWIIEGEEESSSSGLAKLLPGKKEKLAADCLLVVDNGMRSEHKPAITLGVRGICSLVVEVSSTHSDLHSGEYGGLVYNPIHAIVEILAKLRDEEGRIQVPGFYDEVLSPKPEEIAHMDFSFDTEKFEEQYGALPTGGEKSFSPTERLWLRPTVEINGIGGGYQGPGGKTVIPARAFAKLSCRLVPNQEAPHIANLVKNYLENIAPKGVSVKVTIASGSGRPVRVKSDTPLVRALEKSCTEVWSQHPEFVFEGASIPIVSSLAEILHTDLALFGVGIAQDSIHAPNENFGWDRMEKGFLTISKLLDNLAIA